MNINSQRGAALIVVMFVLLLVAVVGSMAIRQSITGLNIATNSQVQSLLQQNTDAVFFAIEQDNKNQNLLERNLSSLGMLGMVKSDQFLSKEVVFCYRPKSQENMFALSKTSVVSWNSEGEISNTELGNQGFCRYQDSDYSSGRDAVISQVAVKKATLNTDNPFKYYPLGTDPTTVQLEQVQPVRIVVTSVIPGAGTREWKASEINACFDGYMNEKRTNDDDKETVASCFSDLGIPYTQQVMDYAVIHYATKQTAAGS
ncbi:pilus assembly PilX family protein [Acinetobacter johnsonii]|jgi:Tfp pilus assembly protein PilX|uniref:pilus assembly PilX family protein n=1 Tax=Acinetobacter johnsonii TaxID=40214 RepID=UPI0015BBBFBA|nr:pilus assembly protein [Acinetobacter johnsonii]MBP7912750.1 hypothetical protein [Streptococcus sp.]MDN5541679.1 pilus assembly protein [Acinetobacter sp.]NWK61085.1 pilus assembly protein [Acinetobacter sp. SwsAc3]MDN5555959.1 pilus assembly protein [Acinetobacter sp.]UIZ93595.1 pilus assembly protein [Acinetobacter johnsonii]